MENNLFKPASDKQLAYLIRLGYEGETDNLTSEECSRLIAEYTAKEVEQKQEPKPTTATKQEVAQTTKYELQEKNISDEVLNRLNGLVETQGLVLPDGYNPANALKSAYLLFVKNDLLKSTTKESQAQALLDMCIQGLNPAQNQCYFIKYGSEVNMMRSYFGDRTACKNAGVAQEIEANIIYKGDTVDVYYQDNSKMKVEHKTAWENMSNEIIGAYAYAKLPNGEMVYDIMTIDRIKKSWSMSKNNTNNKLQQNYTDDACKRTVIRHLAKNLFNSATDTPIVESYNRSTKEEYDNNREFINTSVREVKESQKQQNGTKDLGIEVE